MQIQKDAEIPYYLSFHHFALGMAQAQSGNFIQSEESFCRALELSCHHHEKWIEGASRVYLGITIACKDKANLDKAEEFILEGIKTLDDRKIKPWSTIGRHHLGTVQTLGGKVRQALSSLNTAERLFSEMEMDYWLGLTHRALSNLK